MSGDHDSFSNINFHVGADWRTYCHTYRGTAPILVVDAGGAAVSITIKGRGADNAAVAFARALLHDAQAFADAVERLHAEITTDKADGNTTA